MLTTGLLSRCTCLMYENELMEQAEDPEKYYIEVIMQEKIKLYLEYVEKHSFFYDFGLILKTFKVIVKER